MPTNIEQSVALNLYKSIFGALTNSDSSGKPAFDPNRIYLTMETVGRVIRPLDFANPWSPGNLTGSKEATRNIAALVDDIPQTNPTHTPIGNVSKVYGNIVKLANVTLPPPNPALEKQLKAASAKLWREVEVTDEETGAKSKKTVETELYNDYKKGHAKWLQARGGYIAAFLNAQATTEGRNTWPMLGPTLAAPVKTAWNDWQSKGAERVDDALATLAMSAQNQIGQVFAQAKALYQSYGVDLDGAPELLTLRSRIYPTDWSSSAAGSSWPELGISEGELNYSHTQEASSWSASGGLKLGFWRFGGGGGGSKSHEHIHKDTKNLKISFRWAVCTISRPWMDTGLFPLPDWSVGQLYPPGKISDGAHNQTGTVMPLLPIAFIAVRDVKITAEWSKADRDRAAKATKASASAGWGPLSVSGGYSHSRSSDTFHGEFKDDTLSIPQLQIIGWINRIVEFCPPKK